MGLASNSQVFLVSAPMNQAFISQWHLSDLVIVSTLAVNKAFVWLVWTVSLTVTVRKCRRNLGAVEAHLGVWIIPRRGRLCVSAESLLDFLLIWICGNSKAL